MTPLELAQQHRRDQLALRAGFLRVVVDLWRLLVIGDLRRSVRPWSERTTDAVLEHWLRSARVAAAYYDRARALPLPGSEQPSPRPGQRRDDRRQVDPRRQTRPRFDAHPAPEPDRERVRRRLTGAAVGRMTELRDQGVVDLDRLGREALAETSRVGTELVLGGGRQTLEQAMENDPDLVAWCRITDANPCAFCAMQASRGFVFRSADTAGEKYHPNCACLCMPRFRGDKSPLPSGNQHWQDLWGQTAGRFRGDPDGARKAWRRAIAAQARGEDPVEAALRGTDRSPTDPPRRRRRRNGQDIAGRQRQGQRQDRARQRDVDAQQPSARETQDLLADLRRSLEDGRRRRAGITPDEVLTAS